MPCPSQTRVEITHISATFQKPWTLPLSQARSETMMKLVVDANVPQAQAQAVRDRGFTEIGDYPLLGGIDLSQRHH